MIRLALLFFGLLVIPLMYEVEALGIIDITAFDHGSLEEDSGNDICDDFATSIKQGNDRIGISKFSNSDECERSWFEFSLTSIPDGTTITKVEFIVDVNEVGGRPCDYILLDVQPSTLMRDPIWIGISTNQTTLLNDSICVDNGFVTIDLGTNATTYAENQLGVNWFGLGWKFNNETLVGVNERISFDITPLPILRVSFLDGIPDPINDLIAIVVGDTAIDLSWTVPNLFGGQRNGTQINFTTPFGDPLTIITNKTTTNDTSTTVTGLTSGTDYSFRVAQWTLNGSNAGGNIANGTSAEFGNFTVGFFELDASDFDSRDIKYLRIDEADDITKLEVVYPNAFNLTCTFDYRFQNTNQSFFNLVTVPEGATEQKATFQFNNASREFIRVNCIDENTNTSAPFQLTITQFPILDQLNAYRAGEFGTDGMLGAIDIITLGVVVLIMIGFNRWNESVGGIFAVGLLGGLSYFEIVEWQTFMFGTLAIVIMLIVASTRKT